MQKKRGVAPGEVNGKPEGKPRPNRVANPSERLATLLRKEGMLAAKVRKAQADYRNIQSEIARLWTERENVGQELLSETPEA